MPVTVYGYPAPPVATPQWPSALPQVPLLQGYSETPGKLTVRTEMDVGPAKVRGRYTAEVRRFECQFDMTAAQIVTYEQFFVQTCLGGSLAFEWTHPRTGATGGLYRIVETSWEPRDPDLYFVRAVIELLPA